MSYLLRQPLGERVVRSRPIPDIAELMDALKEQGVEDAPTEAADQEALRGLLDTALWVAEHRKRVRFGDDFSWADPGFWAEDGRVRFRVAYAKLAAGTADAFEEVAVRNLERTSDGRTLLLVDAHTTDAREFELGHRLYGEVTLFQWPHKPPRPRDPRIDAAREKGWVKVLKEHNLLPGRGIVVLDEHQGMLLQDPRTIDLVGIVLFLADGHHHLWWNPFVRENHNDPELQYWLTWAEGTAPSEWREILRVEGERDYQ